MGHARAASSHGGGLALAKVAPNPLAHRRHANPVGQADNSTCTRARPEPFRLRGESELGIPVAALARCVVIAQSAANNGNAPEVRETCQRQASCVQRRRLAPPSTRNAESPWVDRARFPDEAKRANATATEFARSRPASVATARRRESIEATAKHANAQPR